MDLEVDLEKWCNDYGIIAEPIECPRCNKVVELTTPFALKGVRGIKATCDCGNKMSRMISVDEEFLNVLYGLKYSAGIED